MLNEFALNRTADLAADCLEREREKESERKRRGREENKHI